MAPYLCHNNETPIETAKFVAKAQSHMIEVVGLVIYPVCWIMSCNHIFQSMNVFTNPMLNIGDMEVRQGRDFVD